MTDTHGIIDPFTLEPAPKSSPDGLPNGVSYLMIRQRWMRLLSHIKLLGKPTDDTACLDHRRECITLLKEGIPWRAIMRLGLDDPCTHLSDRLYQRERYLLRQSISKPRKPRGPNRKGASNGA